MKTQVRNIQNIYINGIKSTMFDLYAYSERDNAYIMTRRDYIKGWYKKESTIIKKIDERLKDKKFDF